MLRNQQVFCRLLPELGDHVKEPAGRRSTLCGRTTGSATHTLSSSPQLPSHPPHHKSRILCMSVGRHTITAMYRPVMFSISFTEFQFFSQRTHVLLCGIACTCSLIHTFTNFLAHFFTFYFTLLH
jgi:hypothetical protein